MHLQVSKLKEFEDSWNSLTLRLVRFNAMFLKVTFIAMLFKLHYKVKTSSMWIVQWHVNCDNPTWVAGAMQTTAQHRSNMVHGPKIPNGSLARPMTCSSLDTRKCQIKFQWQQFVLRSTVTQITQNCSAVKTTSEKVIFASKAHVTLQVAQHHLHAKHAHDTPLTAENFFLGYCCFKHIRHCGEKNLGLASTLA